MVGRPEVNHPNTIHKGPSMTEVFDKPADLVGQIATGAILQTATGELLCAHKRAVPREYSDNHLDAVRGQFVYEMFGTEETFVPDVENWDERWWPLRKVEISDGQS